MTIKELLSQIEDLKNLAGVETSVIGYSTFNRPIYAFHIGTKSGPQMLMEGGIHAREYLSTLFLIEEVKYLQGILSAGELSGGYYIVPLVNPDGVAIVLEGLASVECAKQQQIVELINGSNNFDLWKANGLGVDLNVNFNAEWGKGTLNQKCPNPENFIGFYPNSEREVNALINFTKMVNPQITLSWHTKGEVIFYGFDVLTETELARDLQIANDISAVNGYPVIKTTGSVGGYSDWVSLNLRVPAYTIELGNASIPHPLGPENLNLAFEQNKNVPIIALSKV